MDFVMIPGQAPGLATPPAPAPAQDLVNGFMSQALTAVLARVLALRPSDMRKVLEVALH